MIRLDQYLVDHQLAETRTKASHLIEQGWVSVNGKVELQKSLKVGNQDVIELNSNKRIYVSLDGYKLEKAIKNFKLDFAGKHVLDIGDKTGGLADCALQHDARSVVIVNIGESRIHDTIRKDKKVKAMDKTDIRTIEPSELPVKSYDFIVVDIAFSSLGTIFPELKKFLHSKSQLLTILKPQLGEPERRMHSGGIIKTEKIRFAGIEKVQEHILNNGYEIIKMTSMDHKDKRSEIIILLQAT